MLKNLIKWSRREFSHLPWRKKRTLYRTLVSEIMLQQTTVQTVLNHFENFLSEYPRIEDLASASEEDVLVSWKGLGYYRRAKNLRKACIDLMEKSNGRFPQSREALLEISGIGPYTASALVAMGRDRPEIAVDSNLERVLARLFRLNSPKGPKLQKEVYQKFWDGELFSKKELKNISYREFNEALMDLGRVYCRARKAHCELCPMSESCEAFQNGVVEKYPHQVKKETKSQEKHQLTLVRVVAKDAKGKLLGYRKNNSEWLSGQYEVPTFILHTTDQSLKQYPKWKGPSLNKSQFPLFKTGITKYTIQNLVYECSEKDFHKMSGKDSFPSLTKLSSSEQAKLSTGSQKALKKLN